MNNIQLGVSQSKGYENEEIFIVCCEVQYGSGSANYFLTDLLSLTKLHSINAFPLRWI